MASYDHFKESGRDLPYAAGHHSENIRAIKQVIETSSSLLVLGLSGSGKSSILRFLVSNPAAQSSGMSFVYIDCNSLDWERDKETAEEEICGNIIEYVFAQRLLEAANFRDNEPARAQLRFLMKDLSVNGPPHLAIIFDRSELLQNRLGEPFFDYLRSLRDINPHLSFAFCGRNLTPGAFGELADILWDEPIWIGALSAEDAENALHRHLARLGLALEVEHTDKLLRCAGRHPGLIKYACELVRAGKVHLDNDEMEIIEQLLVSPSIERQCRDMWQDLDLERQDALRRIAKGRSLPSSSIIEWLMRCGVVDRSENGEVSFTYPLFGKYVDSLGPPPLAVEKNTVFKGMEELVLSREEFNLFEILWKKQPDIVGHDQISVAVWPYAYWEVTPQLINRLVKRLRGKLGDRRYIKSVYGRGYRFIQGTAPLPRDGVLEDPNRYLTSTQHKVLMLAMKVGNNHRPTSMQRRVLSILSELEDLVVPPLSVVG